MTPVSAVTPLPQTRNIRGDVLADLRPLIEAGYARTTSFGVPTPAAFSIPPDLGAALKQSWQALRHLVNPAIPGPTPSVVGVNATNPTPAAAAVPATASVVATATRPGPHKPTTPPATDPTTAAWQAAKKKGRP